MTVYRVSFEANGICQANNAKAENIEDVRRHYEAKGKNVIAITEATEGEIREAERKGMPTVTIEHTEEERKEVKKMSEMKIALTNLGKYNEGYLVYTWLDLPATDEEIEAAYKKIGISDEPDEKGNYYEEAFITDYECDFYEVGEYESIEALNEIAEALEDLDDYEKDIVKALLNEGYDLEQALEQKDDCIVYDDCDSMADVAYRMYEEGILGEIPDHLINYIDWDAYGRDLEFDNQWIATDTGYIEVLR